jgi:hypothetical protein
MLVLIAGYRLPVTEVQDDAREVDAIGERPAEGDGSVGTAAVAARRPAGPSDAGRLEAPINAMAPTTTMPKTAAPEAARRIRAEGFLGAELAWHRGDGGSATPPSPRSAARSAR